MMTVGACRVTLRLPENGSLKGKRQVVRSLTTRLRSKFNVSVAEIGGQDSWQRLVLGVTCVSNDARHARQQLDRVVAFIERLRLDAELLETEIDVSAY